MNVGSIQTNNQIGFKKNCRIKIVKKAMQNAENVLQVSKELDNIADGIFIERKLPPLKRLLGCFNPTWAAKQKSVAKCFLEYPGFVEFADAKKKYGGTVGILADKYKLPLPPSEKADYFCFTVLTDKEKNKSIEMFNPLVKKMALEMKARLFVWKTGEVSPLNKSVLKSLKKYELTMNKLNQITNDKPPEEKEVRNLDDLKLTLHGLVPLCSYL